jgi:ribosomal protein S18 acetylase RimI-like enzyme
MGIGTFMFEQIEHAARLRGCTHIVLEVAENNEEALRFYRKRNFHKLDAAIFLSHKLNTGSDFIEPRRFKRQRRLE